jgi:hypothetical protein
MTPTVLNPNEPVQAVPEPKDSGDAVSCGLGMRLTLEKFEFIYLSYSIYGNLFGQTLLVFAFFQKY